MNINVNQSDWMTVFKETTCAYHKKHPGSSYAGCTCTASWSSRKAAPDEKRENERLALESRKRELEEELWRINTQLNICK